MTHGSWHCTLWTKADCRRSWGRGGYSYRFLFERHAIGLRISCDLHVQISEADESRSSWYAVAAADRQPVPALKDGAGWHIFCLGYVDDEDIAGTSVRQLVVS